MSAIVANRYLDVLAAKAIARVLSPELTPGQNVLRWREQVLLYRAEPGSESARSLERLRSMSAAPTTALPGGHAL
jgi:hypothetical protein